MSNIILSSRLFEVVQTWFNKSYSETATATPAVLGVDLSPASAVVLYLPQKLGLARIFSAYSELASIGLAPQTQAQAGGARIWRWPADVHLNFSVPTRDPIDTRGVTHAILEATAHREKRSVRQTAMELLRIEPDGERHKLLTEIQREDPCFYAGVKAAMEELRQAARKHPLPDSALLNAAEEAAQRTREDLVIAARVKQVQEEFLTSHLAAAAVNATERPIIDDFNADNDCLRESIASLIRLSDEKALVPHGIGGMARGLLAAAYHRLPPHDNKP